MERLYGILNPKDFKQFSDINRKFGYFSIVFDGSSLNESEKTFGISHFIEHLLFYNNESLFEEFNRYHIEANAYTTYNKIVFYISGIEKYVSDLIPLFLENITKGVENKERFEKEKIVVLQELKDVFLDDKNWHFYNRWRKQFNIFNPIGEYGAIKNISFNDLEDFVNDHYIKPSRIINFSNTNIEENIESMNVEFNKNIITKDFKSGNFNVPIEGNFNKKSKTNLIGIQTSPFDKREYNIYFKLFSIFMSGGINSYFFKEIRVKRSLCYSLSYYEYQKHGIFEATINESDAQKVEEIVNNGLERSKELLTEELFDKEIEKLSLMEEYNEIFNDPNGNIFISLESGKKPIEMKSTIKKLNYSTMVDFLEEYIIENKFVCTTNENLLEKTFPEEYEFTLEKLLI